MDIHIDKDELHKIQELQRTQKASDRVLVADFIAFEDVPTDPAKPLSSPTGQKRPHPSPLPRLDPISHVLRFNTPWMCSDANGSHQSTRKYSLQPTERLHQEIVDFANYVSPTEEERFARSEAIKRLSEVVTALWTDASVQVFGSFDSQLFLPSSDLDVVVVVPSLAETILDDYSKPPLNKLAKALLKAEVPVPESLQVITKARVPIVKYMDNRTDFEIDICFNVLSGLEAAKFMQTEMKRQPAVRPLTLVLKYFLQMRALNTVFHGGLGSYTIMCLVISFLQMHPLVQSGMIRAHENLGVLLMELFELYGRNHNSATVGINVKEGGSYYHKEDLGFAQEAKPHLLSIMDPQNENNDIAKGSFAYGSVKQSFEHAFNVLKCAILEFESHLQKNADDTRRPTKEKHPSVETVPSLLGSIITLDPKLLRHRYYIQQTANL